jgi:hypothetical protein
VREQVLLAAAESSSLKSGDFAQDLRVDAPVPCGFLPFHLRISVSETNTMALHFLVLPCSLSL